MLSVFCTARLFGAIALTAHHACTSKCALFQYFLFLISPLWTPSSWHVRRLKDASRLPLGTHHIRAAEDRYRCGRDDSRLVRGVCRDDQATSSFGEATHYQVLLHVVHFFSMLGPPDTGSVSNVRQIHIDFPTTAATAREKIPRATSPVVSTALALLVVASQNGTTTDITTTTVTLSGKGGLAGGVRYKQKSQKAYCTLLWKSRECTQHII